MIRLSNGHVFEYLADSGSLGYDGRGWPWEQPLVRLGMIEPALFTAVAKTITWPKRRGNFRWWAPWRSLRIWPDGTINAFGWGNEGGRWWGDRIGPTINRQRQAVMGSIGWFHRQELVELIEMTNEADLVGLSLNVSCCNVPLGDRGVGQIMSDLEIAWRQSRFPLLLKVGADMGQVVDLVKATRGLVQAVHINSVPFHCAYPERRSPLERYGGGAISGKIAQPWNWLLVERLVQETDTPVIGPSIWEYEDIARVRAMGVKAVSFGSLFLAHPTRPTAYVRRDRRERGIE